MEAILIACGDTDLLRELVAALPPDQFKPIATRKGNGVAEKLAGRGLRLAVVHPDLQDQTGLELCQALKTLEPAPKILFLGQQNALVDHAIHYPVPGPVFRNALKNILPKTETALDTAAWQAFYTEINTRLAPIDQQTYYQMFGLTPDAPHHVIVKIFDDISLRYHPDRYAHLRTQKWGQTLYTQINRLYRNYTEAFAVLADRKSRQKYDDALTKGELRLTDDEALDDGPRSLEDLSTTPAVRKFLKLAQTDLARSAWPQVIQNLRFALSLEPDNQAIAAKIAELTQQYGH